MATDARNAKDDTEDVSEDVSEDRSDPGPKPSASRIAAHAGDHISALTGKSVASVTSVEPAEQGWLVEVEVLEEARIPSSSDMLALYEAELSDDGDLLAYRRTRRYARGRADGGRD
ncbi:gas vesicle protein GvpO [Actinophytocola sp. NPDC049390]|uniref:gas vesicle protein GvpO n=1 Tax=Actinophytocola sp. NPDC049390 TaxID=3363894 RepID=UPI003791C59F